jgi:DNA polymerase I-like protein with 3'-5' exonuclease and polymerase domains
VPGTAAEGFKLALFSLEEKLSELDAQIAHILHDEVIVEASTEIANDVAAIVKTYVEGALNEILSEAPFKVEPKIRIPGGDLK